MRRSEFFRCGNHLLRLSHHRSFHLIFSACTSLSLSRCAAVHLRHHIRDYLIAKGLLILDTQEPRKIRIHATVCRQMSHWVEILQRDRIQGLVKVGARAKASILGCSFYNIALCQEGSCWSDFHSSI